VARSLILEHAGLTKIRPAVGYACLQERTRAHLQTPHELTLRCAGSSLAQSSGEGSVDEHSHHIPPGGCRLISIHTTSLQADAGEAAGAHPQLKP
jgi:hypothetical protein